MNNQKLFIIHNLDDIKNPVIELISIVQKILKNQGAIIFLNGELASGKTAFVQEFARSVGVTSRVQSPTFTLMKSYNVNSEVLPELYKIVHIDAYRLEPHHKEALKVEGFLQEPGTLVFVEWPTAIDLDSSLPFASVNFQIISETMRKISILYK